MNGDKNELRNPYSLYSQGRLNFEFQQACEQSNLDDLNQLLELPPDKVMEMIETDNYRGFISAASRGRLSVIERLMKLAPDQVSLMIGFGDYWAFREAAGNGHLAVLTLLMNCSAPGQVLQMIRFGGFRAFQMAATTGHLEIVNLLVQLAPNLLPEIIREHRFTVLSYFADHNWDDLFNRALLDPGAFAYAEIHQREYGARYVSPFIQRELATLRAMKAAVELANPHAVFNIADDTQATRCFYMIRNLIRRNQPALLDDIRFLLAIPAVQVLAHTPVTGNVPNELLRLALTTGHQEAAAVLLAIPAVEALAAEHQFYPREAGGQFDLEALARDRESSMRALSTSEQQRLQAAISRYEPMMKAAGVDNIMSDLRQTLSARYAEEPACIQGAQGVLIALPLDWHAFQALNLTRQQGGEALKAYCQHKDHTALRYLSKPNPWMAENAAYVNENPENPREKWSTFDAYKPLISMLYLAAQDEGIQPTDGYTLETRLSHFIDELAHIGRAHNWDKTRVNASGVREEYDDGDGDKPSCYSGVNRRLFQAVQGHPLFKILTTEGVTKELLDFMREHFKVHITPDNLAELNGAWTNLLELGERDVCFDELNVSESEQHAFLQYMTEKYALQFTCDTSFEKHITTRFALTRQFPSHLERFAGETSFGDLISAKMKLSHPGESSQSDAKKNSAVILECLASCGSLGLCLTNEITSLERDPLTAAPQWKNAQEKREALLTALSHMTNHLTEAGLQEALLNSESPLCCALSINPPVGDVRHLRQIHAALGSLGSSPGIGP